MSKHALSAIRLDHALLLTLGTCRACTKVTAVSLLVCLSVCLCICLSVHLSITKLGATCIVCLSKLGHYRVLYGILNICNVGLAKNALFKSYGAICLRSPSSTVPDELSINRSDSDGFFLRRRVCMFSDGSHKTTDTWVVVVK